MTVSARKFARLACFAFIWLSSANALAQTTTESGDAGNTLGTAQSVIDGSLQVTGTIGADALDPLTGRQESDVDIFQFGLASGTTLTIQANADVAGDPDMNLLVFNASGQFLAGDDDDNSSCTPVVPFNDSLDSCLTLTLAAGTYYFAVGDNNIGAYETVGDFIASRGNYFADNDSGILGSPSTETVAIVGQESDPPQDTGDYTVYFSSAVLGSGGSGPSGSNAIPVMPVWLLGLMIGLMGLLGARRMKTRR